MYLVQRSVFITRLQSLRLSPPLQATNSQLHSNFMLNERRFIEICMLFSAYVICLQILQIKTKFTPILISEKAQGNFHFLTYLYFYRQKRVKYKTKGRPC